MRVTIICLWITFNILIASSNTIKVRDVKADFTHFSYSNYDMLRKIHEQAIFEGKSIDYSGIDTIKIDIPASAVPLPLPMNIDFDNVTFIVNNDAKDVTLFEYSNKLTPIKINLPKITSPEIYIVEEFINKKVILIVEDQNEWVKNRNGYAHPHIRKDILLLNNGKSINQPIQPYNNDFSLPTYSYCDVTNDSISIENLNYIRTEESTFKTFLIKIQNTNNIKLSHITLLTPKSVLYGDAAFTFNNCTNLTLQDVKIDGTYSLQNKYGYGIVMNNVYNCHINNMYGHGEWGIFGSNNVSTVYIDHSNINRFDIHCYGKNVYCNNTLFRDRYNQFSAFYGDLLFKRCRFDKFVPVTIDGSYSAYTSFNVRFTDCEIVVDPKRPFIFNMTYSRFLSDSIRQELKNMEWQNLFIENLKINWPDKPSTYYIYHTYDNTSVELSAKPIIEITNIFSNIKDIRYSNSEIIIQ